MVTQCTGILFGFAGAAIVIVSKSSVEVPSLGGVLLAIATLGVWIANTRRDA